MKTVTRRLLMTSALVTLGSVILPRLARAAAQKRPDVVVDAIRWSDDDGLTFHTDPVPAGTNVIFQADVRNIGTAAWSPLVVLGVRFTVAGERSWSDTHRDGLNPGARVTLTANGGPDGDRYWNNAAAGTHVVEAWVDDVNRMTELNESNNKRTASITVIDQPVGAPDVIVTAIRWSEDDGQTWHTGPIQSGSNVMFEADIQNQGTGPTPSEVILGVAFRVDGVMQAWSDTHIAQVPAGATVSLRSNGGPDGDKYWNNVSEGTYTLRAHVDDINRIAESDETNNTRDVSVTVQVTAPPPPAVVSGTIASLVGGANIFVGEATSFKLDDLVNLHCGNCRIAMFFNAYNASQTPSPSRFDAVIVSLLQKGIEPYCEFELYSNETGSNVPARTYAKWQSLGSAFAARFKPGSSFLVSQGITDRGVRRWSALNEPDILRGFTTTQYNDMLRGLADGVHSQHPEGKVFPGGYAEPGRSNNTTAFGYLPAIANLINNGTLAGFDIHTYHDRSFAPIYNTYARSHQSSFDRMIAASGITKVDIEWIATEHSVKADPIATNQNYAGLYPGLTHEQVARNWYLTHFFDVHGGVRGNGTWAPGIRITWNLWNYSGEQYHFVSQLQPRIERQCGKTFSMLMNLLHNMRFTFNDPKGTGVHKLKGGGKSAWVFQNLHSSWSSRFGSTFVIDDIPAAATQIQVYDGNGLIQTVNNPSKPSHTFSTPTGKSYLFVANAE